ncbi:hypothetical protein MOST_12490 [Moorella stamsii]|uniref:Uncharacterized protein n=1 Tax=Neomoorella stamsii TaxID=1266720 RepID=A0A9X7P6K0_9FIRM|nr:hypothetical protein MOST_12490 [Moorella stamsii]
MQGGLQQGQVILEVIKVFTRCFFIYLVHDDPGYSPACAFIPGGFRRILKKLQALLVILIK